MSLKKPLRLAGALVLSAVAVALAAAPAQAADPFRPTPNGCFAVSGGGCTTLDQANGLWTIKVSPDGRFAYASAWGDSAPTNGALHVFTRDTATGKLNWAACYREPATGPCAGATGLGQPDDIEITPDGRFLYVSSWRGSIAAFERKADGTLDQFDGAPGCINNSGAPCEDGRGFVQPAGMVMSPDGKHLYASQLTGIVSLQIDSDGTLDQVANQGGCINDLGTDGCQEGRALGTAMRQIAISPDGAQVFAASRNRRGLVVLDRDATTGGLTQPAGPNGCVSFDGNSGEAGEPCGAEPRIGEAGDTVHAVGSQVYLMHSTGIVTFRRDAGGLAFQSCINDAGSAGCANGRNVQSLGYADHTPDGQHLIVGMLEGTRNRIAFFARDGAGNLASVPGKDGCVSADGFGHDSGAVQANACFVSQAAGHGGIDVFDDSHFYSGNYYASTVGAFVRDFYPQCQDKAVDVPHGTSRQVDLTCVDRNGEAVDLAIVDAPVGGSLGAIDQANDRVFYNAFPGFSGTDAFTYRATAGALTSEPAKVTLNIAAPPVDNDKDGVSPPADCDDNNAAARPGAIEVPGNAVDEDCVGGPAALPPGRIRAGVDYFFDARNKRYTKVGKLDVTSIIAGATVQVTCKTKKKGCKFTRKRRTFSKAASKFSVKRYFNFTKKIKRGKKTRKRKIVSKLKKGTIIEIRVTAPNMIGMVVTFTTRRGKTPTFTVKCLPLGATKPQSTC